MITMGEAVPFPSLKILSIKTVNTYVVMNETIDAHGKSDEPGMAKVVDVKRKTGSKKKSESNEEATGEAPVDIVSEKVVSKKRPTVMGDEATITKKKRTTKSKASSSKASMDMVSVAQDVVPLQIFKPNLVAIAEQPPVLKHKSKKRKLRLPKGSDDENVEERVAVENVENVEKPITVEVTVGEIVVEPTEEERHASAQLETTDYVDVIIEQVIAETSQLVTNESYEDFVSRDAEHLIVSTSDLDKGTGTGTAETIAGEQQVPMFVEKGTVSESEGSKDVVVAKVFEKSVSSNQTDEEQMSLDDLLMQISDEMVLSSVTAAEITKTKSDFPVKFKEVHDQDWYYASLPKISATEKGKAPLEEADTVNGNPASEMVQLICADVDFLVQLRQQVMQDVVEFFHSFSINKLSNLESLRELAKKEKHMLLWAETDSLEAAVKRRAYILANSVVDVLEKIPNKFCSVFQQGIDTNNFVGYFGDSGVQPVLQSVQDIELLSSDGSTVYRSPSSQYDSIFYQDDLMDFHVNSDSDEQTSDHQFDLPVSTTNVGSTQAVAQFMDFHANSDSDEQTSDHQFDLPVSTTIVGSTPVVAPLSIPATDITESFAQLHASIEDIRFEQIRRKDDTDRLRDLDRAYRTFLSNSRKDSQDLRTVLSLDLSTSQKKLSTQFAAAALDNVDGRKKVKELIAKVTYLDGQVAAIRNDLLNFHAKAEENHLNLSTQLGFLIDYINRGGDAKKGESGSSQPLPPPDDQSRPSGGSGDSGSQRRSGSSKGRRSSGESPVRGIRYGPYPPGAPPKRSAKFWMTGEKDF
ncbi:TMV resistance protein N-like [Dorcoceras hygrometricum]|uniref:TMV resistance protein N-like n=1 Tax=Dorcoceras hygrometricum TaxID=472368 RepID=A0A2Z7BY48_9LAMI|nr:TMV resistance protein N-like [Dorcoceras hygrometricum]